MDGSAVGVLILSLPANTFKVQQFRLARSLRSTALASFFPSFIMQLHPFVDHTQTETIGRWSEDWIRVLKTW